MKKTLILSLALLATVVLVAGVAFAYGPGYGRGGGMGYGYGPGPGYYAQGQNALDEETIQLQTALYQKQLELNAVMAASEVDVEKAKALTAEIAQIRGQLAQKAIEAQIEFRENNPDVQSGYGYNNCPRYNGGGGWGRGYGCGGRAWQ